MCYVTDALLASSGGLMRDRHYQDTSLSGMREMKREREGGYAEGVTTMCMSNPRGRASRPKPTAGRCCRMRETLDHHRAE